MPTRSSSPSGLWLLLALLAGVPALVLRVPELLGHGSPLHLSPGMEALTFGAAIVGCAFLLAWAAEVAQLDVSQALALAGVALIAVLPEYAVDLYFAWRAGVDPEYTAYAAANMTGANRLLVGIGWPLVALLFWLKRRASLRLSRGLSLELVFLGIATLYSFSIALKSSIALWDAAVLIGLFGAYMWLSARAEKREPELVGPAALLGRLPAGARRASVGVLFLFAAGVIILSAEPFAEGLLQAGREAGIDEFLMVQWVAPLASEAPEILVAVILTLRGDAGAAMIALISAKVNQWTLLVGSLPVVYSFSSGAPLSLPLDARQTGEFLLTSAQSLFAVVLLVRLHISWRGALALLVLFLTQLAIPNPTARLVFSFIYLGATASLLIVDRGRLPALVRMGWTVVTAAVRRSPS